MVVPLDWKWRKCAEVPLQCMRAPGTESKLAMPQFKYRFPGDWFAFSHEHAVRARRSRREPVSHPKDVSYMRPLGLGFQAAWEDDHFHDWRSVPLPSSEPHAFPAIDPNCYTTEVICALDSPPRGGCGRSAHVPLFIMLA